MDQSTDQAFRQLRSAITKWIETKSYFLEEKILKFFLNVHLFSNHICFISDFLYDIGNTSILLLRIKIIYYYLWQIIFTCILAATKHFVSTLNIVSRSTCIFVHTHILQYLRIIRCIILHNYNYSYI